MRLQEKPFPGVRRASLPASLQPESTLLALLLAGLCVRAVWEQGGSVVLLVKRIRNAWRTGSISRGQR